MKDALIRKAVALLSLAGVDYAIEMPSGEIVGKLLELPSAGVEPGSLTQPVAEPPPKAIRRRRPGPRRDWQTLFPGYPDQIRAMPASGKLDWRLPDASLAVSFQKCVTSVAHNAFGSGNYMTAVDPKTGTVELVRV